MAEIIVTINSMFEPLIPEYLENRRKECDVLDELFAQQDWSEMEVIAHKLGGNAGTYGLLDLGNMGKKLEVACQNEGEAEIKDLLQSIRVYVTSVKVQYS